MERITHTQLLGIALAHFEREIQELEEKRDGNPEHDELINRMQELPKARRETVLALFEIETGKTPRV